MENEKKSASVPSIFDQSDPKTPTRTEDYARRVCETFNALSCLRYYVTVRGVIYRGNASEEEKERENFYRDRRDCFLFFERFSLTLVLFPTATSQFALSTRGVEL